MNKLKITQGIHKIHYSDTGHACSIRTDNKKLCVFRINDFNELNSVATLYEDAGNTYQKCNLLPSELLAQRNELLEALKSLLKEARANSFNLNHNLNDSPIEANAEQAIKNATNEQSN